MPIARGPEMPKTEMASFRLPGDVVAALRTRAEVTGETFSDVLRRAALQLLGICPTCGQAIPGEEPEGKEAG